MKLQIASRLAVYAVLELAGQPDAHHSAAEIGHKYGISTHHLSKVLHTLGRAGLVRAVRGAGGGYQFVANPKRTTLMDVIRLFEPDSGGQGSDTPGEDTSVGLALGVVLGEIDEIAEATLNSITISTMLKIVDGQIGSGRDVGSPHGTAA